MNFPVEEVPRERFPPKLLEIPDPPEELFIRGQLPAADAKYLCVVGARSFSEYGRAVCQELIEGLRGQNIVVVSGLALGIDSIAHRAALRAGLQTIAVPGSGIEDKVIYPAIHKSLAKSILEAGGCLLSEFPPNFRATVDSFPQRNRIMAGLSDAILIIEAEKKSGTMITARLACDYNRDVLTIPGSIFSENSGGPHYLIQTGATPITSPQDLLEALGVKTEKSSQKDAKLYENCSAEERQIIELLQSPITRGDLEEKSQLSISQLNSLLSILELKEMIKERGGEIFLL